jgi:hypothetical protein
MIAQMNCRLHGDQGRREPIASGDTVSAIVMGAVPELGAAVAVAHRCMCNRKGCCLPKQRESLSGLRVIPALAGRRVSIVSAVLHDEDWYELLLLGAAEDKSDGASRRRVL